MANNYYWVGNSILKEVHSFMNFNWIMDFLILVKLVTREEANIIIISSLAINLLNWHQHLNLNSFRWL